MSDEQRVRTVCGWIGVEISRSRVRTPGKAGYGLYRVRGSVGHRTPAELDGLTPGAVTEDGKAERGPWTAYAFTLKAIEEAAKAAIEQGRPERPGVLRVAGRMADRGPVAHAVPTRWTSAYRGSRTLGTGSGAGYLDEVFSVPCRDETEPDGDICPGTLAFKAGDAQAKCDTCGGWAGRFAPTVRQRQREQNAAFQKAHRERRVYGKRAYHAMRLRRNASG